jgi:hypothetical protein
MREEGNYMLRIVQLLEMCYGDLCTPEEARVKTNTMRWKENEGLSEFIDRLRAMAKMACLMQMDEAIWRQETEHLVEGNICRVLPTSVHNALQERMTTRSSLGLPTFNAKEIEKECLDLKKLREERRALPVSHEAIKARAHIHRIEANTYDELNSSADEADIEGSATYHLINI